MMMRRFQLVRYVDPSGVSGTGIVAEGVQFTDQTVTLRWCSGRPATTVWNGIDDVLAVHGHQAAPCCDGSTPNLCQSSPRLRSGTH
jgi:hypothetical protein